MFDTSVSVRDVVREKVDGDELFTAFDISKKVQSLAANDGLTTSNCPGIRHGSLKDEIHREVDQYVQSGLYQRQLWDVGAPAKAFLYYPVGSDPNSYVAQQRKDNHGTITTVNAVTNTDDDDDDDDDDDCDGTGVRPSKNSTTRIPDARGSISVPTRVCRDAGFQVKDTVVVTIHHSGSGNTLVLSKNATNPVTKYTVNCNQSIRVTNGTLKKAGFNGGKFDFEVNKDEVVVKVS